VIEPLNLHAFADGELSSDEMARLDKEIAESPEASRELEAIRSLKTCLQTRLDQPDAGTLWKQCASRLDELDKVKRAETFVGKYAWALSALLFVVILSGGMLNRMRGSSVGVGQVASISSDMTSMSAPRLSQPEQLRSWITDQTGHRPRIVVDPAKVRAYAYTDQIEGRIVRFQIDEGNGTVELMVIPNITKVEGVRSIGDGMFAGQINGLNCVTWPDSGCAVIVIGNQSVDALKAFGRTLYR
jgi:anti-sigma factor RsiW